MTEISVTRALAEVKSLNDRITRATNVAFISHTVGGKHASGSTPQEIAALLTQGLQSVRDMIARRAKIKAAIVASNAKTPVVVAKVQMTVAEAIERKASIQLDKTLLATLKQQRTQAIQQVERTNQAVAARLDQLIQTTVGKDRKVGEEELKAISDPFEAANKAALLDPSKLDEVIQKLQDSIDAFELDVDYALNEVNATTRITI